jgi:hypothetical protein
MEVQEEGGGNKDLDNYVHAGYITIGKVTDSIFSEYPQTGFLEVVINESFDVYCLGPVGDKPLIVLANPHRTNEAITTFWCQGCYAHLEHENICLANVQEEFARNPHLEEWFWCERCRTECNDAVDISIRNTNMRFLRLDKGDKFSPSDPVKTKLHTQMFARLAVCEDTLKDRYPKTAMGTSIKVRYYHLMFYGQEANHSILLFNP